MVERTRPRVALATLAIGEHYLSLWRTYCEPGWKAYCERHGYDIVVLAAPLDTSQRAQARSPAWQKCLILETPAVQAFDRVVWVDADIVINPSAPAIVDSVPPDKVGAVDESRFPTREINLAINRAMIASHVRTNPALAEHLRRSEYAPYWHQDGGTPFDERLDAVVQTGVMVLSREHAGLLRFVYDNYEDKGSPVYLYEMRPLSYEIQTRGRAHWVDGRFNASVAALISHDSLKRTALPTHAERVAAVRRFYRENYFLHFCGFQHVMHEIAAAMLEMSSDGR